MRTSEGTMELFTALAKLELTNPPKTSTAKIPTKKGGEFSYTFAPLADILKHIRLPLRELELSVLQETSSNENGAAVTTRIAHSSGEWIEMGPLTIPTDPDARAYGSALTYGRRYQLCAALNIAADADDDADAAQPKAQRKSSAASAQAAGTGVKASGPNGEGVPASSQPESVKGESSELESAGDSPFATDTEEYGYWNALVLVAGSDIKALNTLNQVVKPPYVKSDVGFANAKQLIAALEKLEASA